MIARVSPACDMHMFDQITLLSIRQQQRRQAQAAARGGRLLPGALAAAEQAEAQAREASHAVMAVRYGDLSRAMRNQLMQQAAQRLGVALSP